MRKEKLKKFAIAVLTLAFILSSYAPAINLTNTLNFSRILKEAGSYQNAEVMAAQTIDYNTIAKNYDVQVYIDSKDNPVVFPSDMGKPFIACDRTFVPYRILAEKMGAKVGWEQATKRVTAQNTQSTVVMTLGESHYTVNGTPKTMEVEPFAITSEQRTYIPARYVTEGLGYTVDFTRNDTTACVVAFTKGQTAVERQAVLNDVAGVSNSTPVVSPDTEMSSDAGPNEPPVIDDPPIPIAEESSFKIEGNHYIILGDFDGVTETPKYIIEKQSKYIGTSTDVIRIYAVSNDRVQITCTNHPEFNPGGTIDEDSELNQYFIKGTGYKIPVTKGMNIELETSDGDLLSITI